MLNIKRRHLFISGHFIIWVLVFLLPFVLPGEPDKYTWPFLINWTRNVLMSVGIFYLFYGHIIRTYLKSNGLLKFFLISVVTFVAYTLLETVIEQLTIPLLFPEREINSMSKFAGWFILNMFLVGLALLILLIENWFSVQKYQQQVERERLESELKMLRFQVNPHFLFNTLNNIYTLVYKKSDRAPEAILKLSALMRYMLYETGVDKAPLAKELEYLENFVELQRLRLVSDQRVMMRMDGDTDGYEIAPLLLVPFIENAFKHGIRASKETVIEIDISVKEGILLFMCSNDYRPDISSQINSGIGLANVRKRLELIYQGRYSLTTGAKDNRYSVNLTITL